MEVDSQRNILSEMKTFARWLEDEGHMSTEVREAFEKIKGTGQRNKGGKGASGLSIVQLLAFLEKARQMALDEALPAETRERAACALFVILTGQRASEVVGLKAKAIDDDATWVQVLGELSKTPASVRTNFMSRYLGPSSCRT